MTDERIWTDEQVANLARRQASSSYHPYTCGVCTEGRLNLVPTPEGWRCPLHGLVQKWAHKEDLTGETLEWAAILNPFGEATND